LSCMPSPSIRTQNVFEFHLQFLSLSVPLITVIMARLALSLNTLWSMCSSMKKKLWLCTWAAHSSGPTLQRGSLLQS
jgi:hypothetical protein